MNEYPKINCLWKRDEKGRIMKGEVTKEEFENLINWHVTEKVDGTNIRIGFDGEKVIIKGRKEKSEIPSHLSNYLSEFFTVDYFKNALPSVSNKKIVLYGEGYGQKIQKVGKHYRSDNSFILFDMQIDDIWLKQEVVRGISQSLGLECVPYIASMTIDQIVNYVENEPQSIVAHNNLRMEGVIARSQPLVMFRYEYSPVMFKLRIKDFKSRR